MPNVASSLGTTQRYIPLVNATELGKAAGLHMHFPTLAALNAAVTAERLNIDDTSGLWAAGQSFSVATEPAPVRRTWLIGGSSAASHARTVHLRAGLSVVLAADSNTVLSTTGAPASGTGANGDVAVDYAANLYYTKASGAWDAGVAVYAGGSSSLVSPNISGIETHSGTDVFTAAAMAALAIDVTKARNTKSVAADSTVTFSATPADGQEWGLELTCDATNRTITLPASCVRVGSEEAITSFVMPASRKAFITFRRVSTTNYVDGVPGVKIMLPFAIETPENGDYVLLLKSIWAGKIDATTTKSTSGTCTATFKVNTTALGGTANSVSSTEQTQNQTTSNNVAVGDDIAVTISANSSCSKLVGSIEMTVY